MIYDEIDDMTWDPESDFDNDDAWDDEDDENFDDLADDRDDIHERQQHDEFGELLPGEDDHLPEEDD